VEAPTAHDTRPRSRDTQIVFLMPSFPAEATGKPLPDGCVTIMPCHLIRRFELKPIDHVLHQRYVLLPEGDRAQDIRQIPHWPSSANAFRRHDVRTGATTSVERIAVTMVSMTERLGTWGLVKVSSQIVGRRSRPLDWLTISWRRRPTVICLGYILHFSPLLPARIPCG